MTMNRAMWQNFPSRAEVAEALADAVAARLEQAIATKGAALLAVSGGATPGAFFAALSQRPIAWGKVHITLVDERQVAPDSERSNQRLVRRHLLQGPAARAGFVALEEKANAAPPDVAVLGMGTDGHTASIFADAPNAAALLDPDAPPAVLPVAANADREARLTMNLPLLAQARHLFVHIEGSNKKTLLAGWLAGTSHPPIAAVIAHARAPAEIYWAPLGEAS